MFSFSPRKFHSVLIAPLLLPILMLFNTGSSDNHPPVAVDDSFTVHCCARLEVTANDSDPDNEVFFLTTWPSTTAHGTLASVGNGVLSYRPNSGYVGSDSFQYSICDSQHACATATVTLDVVNQAPIGRPDSFNIHGNTVISGFLGNDSDPDQDGIICGNNAHPCVEVFPQHGRLDFIGIDRYFYFP